MVVSRRGMSCSIAAAIDGSPNSIVAETLEAVVSAVHRGGGVCIVTADHGNAEEMLTPEGTPQTAHSLNPVPLIITSEAVTLAGHGILADVAPTALALLGVAQPAEMHGKSLLR